MRSRAGSFLIGKCSHWLSATRIGLLRARQFLPPWCFRDNRGAESAVAWVLALQPSFSDRLLLNHFADSRIRIRDEFSSKLKLPPNGSNIFNALQSRPQHFPQSSKTRSVAESIATLLSHTAVREIGDCRILTNWPRRMCFDEVAMMAFSLFFNTFTLDTAKQGPMERYGWPNSLPIPKGSGQAFAVSDANH